MKVLLAEFVTSAGSPAGAPHGPGPRIALVGRSNVGKSSLINALTRRRIARASATPGRTRLANFYRVEFAPLATPGARPSTRLGASGRGLSTVWLVDLPGYGYTGRSGQSEFAQIAEGLLKGTVPFSAALLVVDARHPGLEADRVARDWLVARGLAVGIVVTKVDKLSRAARGRAVQAISATLGGPALAFSAATGEGRNELWKTIVELARERMPEPAQE